MKQFLDFFTARSLLRFFYKIYDIYAATTALIVATAVVLIYSWVRYRKVEKMALITFVLVAVFGGLTIFFHNDEFIKWKVTVIYALFAGALLFSQWVMKKTAYPTHAWQRADAAAAGVVTAESGPGAVLYSLRAGQYLHRVLAAAKISGSTSKSSV